MNSELQNEPFFIVGSTRSGTTLLRLMLNEHHRLSVPRESCFIIGLINKLPLNSPLSQEEKHLAYQFISNHERWKDWEVPNEKLLDVIVSLEQPLLGELIDTVFHRFGNPKNKPRWGDKTPFYVDYIDLLHQLFPNAKFIHIIRDGRDVCLSLLKTRWWGSTIVEIAKYWTERVNNGLGSGRKLGSELYFEIKYEELVLDTEKTLKQLCAFLGEDYDSRMLDFHKHASTELAPRQRKLKIHEKTKSPPQPSDTYRWRKEMNVIGVAIFEAIAGETMERVGQNRYFQGTLRIIPYLFKVLVKFRDNSRPLRQKFRFKTPNQILRQLGLVSE